MKKMLAVMLLMMMCCACTAESIAEIPSVSFETYSQSFAGLTEEEWKADEVELIQMISPEEGVTVSACLSAADVAALTVEFPCDQITDSVRAAIANLGWLSVEAIEQVMTLEDDARLEIEGCIVYRVHGENRDAFSICPAEMVGGMVWQPIHGGKKLHMEIECSGMDVSRMITADAAELTGWEDCKRCDVEEEDAQETAE